MLAWPETHKGNVSRKLNLDDSCRAKPTCEDRIEERLFKDISPDKKNKGREQGH